ncbi:MAG: prolyl oligopeptidase family serine peptidase [Bacillota bacterium]|nr:prolyl oligopeptidase family serine peptidase [Bacillota bacterium]
MNRNLKKIIASVAMLATFTGCSSSVKSTGEDKENQVIQKGGTYCLVIEGFDWGPAVTKAILKSEKPEENPDKNDFTVHVKRSGKNIISGSQGYRPVTKAYQSDEKGSPSAEGGFITLEMNVGPEEPLGSPFNYDLSTGYNDWVESDYTITHKSTGQVWNVQSGESRLLADDFKKGKVTYKDITLGYASYEPNSDSKKNPLIIWLHGSGEGGADPDIVLLGNKVVNLASEEIQSIFQGAYILAPQSPTMWMDGGNGQYAFDGTSMYTEALMNLIQCYVEQNNDIDRDRIYIGGCSNGGFMTMKMILTYPDYFAAAFPICEAYFDARISDEQLNSIKNIPIWFTHAKNDMTVDPDVTVVRTYNRLLKAGAKDVHFTFWDKVLDTTGFYKNGDGSPYNYNGHFSWVYVLNNQCRLDYDGIPVRSDGEDLSIMEWLAVKRKGM